MSVGNGSSRFETAPKKVYTGAALLTAALLSYSQTKAFAWDEGFHLLAAQLIHNGRRPYLDFFFPQTPLNAYWNAAWMQLFGETWRTAHVAAALCTACACLLVAQYLYTKLGAGAALCSLAAFGLNELVFRFGGIAQAYGFCLLMLVSAFRCTVLARERLEIRYAALAGLFSSAAAAASLLTVPAPSVFLLWLIFYGRSLRKTAAFLSAAAIPFLPVLILAWQAPRAVFFQVFEYNTTYRAVLWEGDSALWNNLAVYGSFFRSPDALLLTGLGLFGFLKARRAPDVLLCAFLSGALALYTAAAFPTFARYFVFVVPFLTVLAIIGLLQVAPARHTAAALIFSMVPAFWLARTLSAERKSYGWSKMEEIARKVNEVTAPGATILADEQIYFLARRTPPSGMEHENSHKQLNLSSADLAALHVIPEPDLDRMIKAGAFATIATCDDQETISDLGFPTLYRHSSEAGECTVYWQKKGL